MYFGEGVQALVCVASCLNGQEPRGGCPAWDTILKCPPWRSQLADVALALELRASCEEIVNIRSHVYCTHTHVLCASYCGLRAAYVFSDILFMFFIATCCYSSRSLYCMHCKRHVTNHVTWYRTLYPIPYFYHGRWHREHL